MKIKIGINGMGRIGRLVLRSIVERNNKKIEIKHINNRTAPEIVAQLVKYDSIHGMLSSKVSVQKNHLLIDGKKISFSQETDIENINWKKYGVDIVFECTGKFNSREQVMKHIINGANKVVVSAPCKNADKTIVFGVNEKKY